MIDKLIKNPRYLDCPGVSIDFGEGKWGVLLFNMGGPGKAEDTGLFLYNLFSDSNLIRLPSSEILQKPLAKLIAIRKAPKAARQYQAIGGSSPLLKWTRLAASGVKRELSKQYPHVEAFVGMRYFEPYISDELDAAVDEGCRHIVLMSMYPQYCRATTGTALVKAAEWLDDTDADISLSLIGQRYNRPEYINLLRGRIESALEEVDRTRAKIVFLAHSVPQRLVDAGDPRVRQVKETVTLAGEGYDCILTFRRRNGLVRWIGPDTYATIRRLAREGVTDVVAVPISFVFDHVEILYGIDIRLRQAAVNAGIKRLIRTESLNDDPRFVGLMADLIEAKIAAR
jgi:ferrochelatase